MAIAMGWHKPDNVAGSSAPAIMVGLFVATGGLLFGYDTGYASFLSSSRWDCGMEARGLKEWKYEKRWKRCGHWTDLG
jgi:hypothetical protein